MPCSWVALAVGALLVVAHTAHTAQASDVDVGLDSYEDMLMQSLYKRLSQIDTEFLEDEANDRGYVLSDYNGELQAEPSSQKVRDMPATAIRDSEKIEHSSNAGSHGPIHMSGGSGEAKQHLSPDGSIDNSKTGAAAIKSDDSLPFYCHPPNPCPKGSNATDDCHKDIEDTAEVQKEWITNMMLSGSCPCDHEHMFNCPEAPATLDMAMKDRLNDSPRYTPNKVDNLHLNGEKIATLVAKKSPRVKRVSE